MRLIDKDMLIEILGEMQGLCDTKAALIQNSKIWQQVKDLPAVDAVPVIRCKDCKHWQCDDSESYCDELGIFDTDMNSYCSYAKRKEE